MTTPNVDISGNPLPPDQLGNGGATRVLAIPPVRDYPNEQAVEFLWTGYKSLPAAGTDFLVLTDPTTAGAFAQLIQPVYQARIDSLLMWCPDMVAATDPYLFTSMTIKNQLANAWGTVPIYPRDGVASLSYEPTIDLGPGSLVQVFGKNTDPVNAHLVVYEIHGWYWPKALIQT